MGLSGTLPGLVGVSAGGFVDDRVGGGKWNGVTLLSTKCGRALHGPGQCIRCGGASKREGQTAKQDTSPGRHARPSDRGRQGRDEAVLEHRDEGCRRRRCRHLPKGSYTGERGHQALVGLVTAGSVDEPRSSAST